MTEIRDITDAQPLADFVRTQPLQPFLQSWAWGEFQSKIGRKIWRLGIWEGKELCGSALVIQHELMLGKTYLYCPRGPLAKSPDIFQTFMGAIEELGQKEGAMYAKVDPNIFPYAFDVRSVPDSSTGTTLQPRQTLVIDVSKSPAEILSSMHQKTRYNIRLAEKRGVTVRWSTDDADLGSFMTMMRATYARQGIRLHSDTYYQTMFETLREANMCEFAIAEYEGAVVAANMVIWHDQTVTYLHGGSADSNKDVMAPHLLQWRTIERAHERGARTYDLWGIAPENQPQHKWSGVTRFKKGLGGHVEVFPAAVNVILQPSWYMAYRLAKRMRGGVDA